MDANVRGFSSSTHQSTQEMHIKKGPWTSEEDSMLTNHVITQGEGRWNSVARCSGLKRTGKSCRLRWLNYLRPNVRHGNMTLQEQLLILELQSRWGNRWSKIAQQLPGRTDNEIKNYWRTRVQKQAKQLKFDVNSQQFRDAMRYVWIPHLSRKIEAASESTTTACTATTSDQRDMATANLMPKLSGASSETWDTHVSHVSPFSGLTDYNNLQGGSYLDSMQNGQGLYPENCPSPWGCLDIDAFEEHRNG